MNTAAEINRLHTEVERCTHTSRESLHAALAAAWGVHRNAITLDERHPSVVQRERVRELAAELGRRLTNGAPAGIAAVHRDASALFSSSVISCAVPGITDLLIPRTQGEEALTFLWQQRAIHGSRLREARSGRL